MVRYLKFPEQTATAVMDKQDTDTEMGSDYEEEAQTNGANGNVGHDSDEGDEHVPNQVVGKSRGRKKGKKGGVNAKSTKSPVKKAVPRMGGGVKPTGRKGKGAAPERKSTRQPQPTSKPESDEKESYEVAKILNVRYLKNGKKEFEVQWKGWSLKDSTWEPEANLNCKDLVKEFLAKQKDVKSKTGTKKGPSSSAGKKANRATDDEEEYEVVKILSVRFVKNGTKEFQVQWKGYSVSESTWEPEQNLECTQLLMEFAARVSDLKSKSGSGSKGSRKGRPAKSPAKSMSDQSEDDGPNEEYEVTKILDVRTVKNGKKKFKVQWKGYSLEEATWEPEENLECKSLLKDFMAEKNTTKSTEPAKAKKRPAGRPPGPASKTQKIKMPKMSAKSLPPTEEVVNEEEPEVEEDDYEVEKILAVRNKKGKREFNIKWKGWGEEDSTWEPEDNLSCKDLLEAFMENEAANSSGEEEDRS